MTAITSAPHRGADGGARASDSPAFRHAVHRVWRLGPRPVAELLLEVATDHDTLIRRLDRFAGLDPAVVDAAGGRDWLERRALLRRVEP
jgi:hypothetical protein